MQIFNNITKLHAETKLKLLELPQVFDYWFKILVEKKSIYINNESIKGRIDKWHVAGSCFV